MDFEEIDSKVYGDDLIKGDIIYDAPDFHRITGIDDGEDDMIVLTTYNLSTGEHDDTVLVDPDSFYSTFQGV